MNLIIFSLLSLRLSFFSSGNKARHLQNVNATFNMAYSDSVTWVLPLLCCPDCGAAIYELDQTHYCCHHCGWHGKDSRDLLCQNPRPRHLVHNRKPSLQPESCLYHLATEPPKVSIAVQLQNVIPLNFSRFCSKICLQETRSSTSVVVLGIKHCHCSL